MKIEFPEHFGAEKIDFNTNLYSECSFSLPQIQFEREKIWLSLIDMFCRFVSIELPNVFQGIYETLSAFITD